MGEMNTVKIHLQLGDEREIKRMWRDYCTRLKERSSGMGALKNDDVLYDSKTRVNPNMFQPPASKKMKEHQVLFPGYLCPPYAAIDEGEFNPLPQTHVVWSPLFEGLELKDLACAFLSDGELPAGWRTAEQKLLEMKTAARSHNNGDFENIVSSTSSNSDEERSTVWTSAKCLLHMKGILDSGRCTPVDERCRTEEHAMGVEESFLIYNNCDFASSALDPVLVNGKFEKQGQNIMLQDYNSCIEMEKPKNYQSEVSVEDSKYHTCSGGDGSVCSSGIGRGRLSRRGAAKDDLSLNHATGDTRSCHAMVNRGVRSSIAETRNGERKNANSEHGFHGRAASSPGTPRTGSDTRQVKNNDRKIRRMYPHAAGGSKEDKAKDSNSRAPKTWNAGSKGPMQRMRRERAKEPAPHVTKDTEKVNKETAGQRHSERKHHWCLQRRSHQSLSDELTSAASTTMEEESVGTRAKDHSAELASTLAEMNSLELRALQCSAAVMRHNIGVLQDDVEGLQGCLDHRKSMGYSWWSLFKDFVVAASLVSGAFGLRTIIDKTVRYGGLKKITNKQEKMALAAFVLTVGARFSKQIWKEQGKARSHREIKLREHFIRIKERVALMSSLAATPDPMLALPAQTLTTNAKESS